MKDAKVLMSSEVREILAEHFGVPVENIIQSKYSFIIVSEEKKV